MYLNQGRMLAVGWLAWVALRANRRTMPTGGLANLYQCFGLLFLLLAKLHSHQEAESLGNQTRAGSYPIIAPHHIECIHANCIIIVIC